MNTDTPSKRNWAYILSPCVILAILFAAIIVLYTLATVERAEERAYMIYAILLILPSLIISLLIDLILRFFLKQVKKKVLYIWVIEMTLILFAFSLLIFGIVTRRI